MHAQRQTTDRFSIGDLNKVNIKLTNKYPFAARVSVIDELPEQFQERNWLRKAKVESNASYEIEYSLKPLVRGGVCVWRHKCVCSWSTQAGKKEIDFSGEENCESVSFIYTNEAIPFISGKQSLAGGRSKANQEAGTQYGV